MIRKFCSKVINFYSKCWRSDLNVERLRCAFISENEVNASNVKKKKIFYRKEQIKLKEKIIRYLYDYEEHIKN